VAFALLQEVPIRVSATSYYPPLMKGMATLADDKKKNRKNVAAKI
jgi:hypothetical protein